MENEGVAFGKILNFVGKADTIIPNSQFSI